MDRKLESNFNKLGNILRRIEMDKRIGEYNFGYRLMVWYDGWQYELKVVWIPTELEEMTGETPIDTYCVADTLEKLIKEVEKDIL